MGQPTDSPWKGFRFGIRRVHRVGLRLMHRFEIPQHQHQHHRRRRRQP